MLLRNVDCRLVLVDFDKIEQKNIQSQFHTSIGLRANKAVSLGNTLRGMWNAFSGNRLRVIPNKLTKDNVDVILEESDIIIDCTDNAETRRIIQNYAKRKSVPCLHGGLSADGRFFLLRWTDHFNIDEEDEAGQATCEDGENLPFHALAASHMAMEIQRFIETRRSGVGRHVTESSVIVLP